MSVLERVWAKSRQRPSDERGELLTEHLAEAGAAARKLRDRVGHIPGMPSWFWECVILACLLHDAGKVPDGFQRMVGNPEPATRWGQRHEVYSLGFAAHVLAALPAKKRDLVMIGVGTHHWPLESDGSSRSLKGLCHSIYRSPGQLMEALGPVDPRAAAELYAWLVRETGQESGPAPALDELGQAAHQELEALIDKWTEPFKADPARDLTGVLIQGAVTLADHVASARTDLIVSQPVDAGYSDKLASQLRRGGRTLFRHQQQAGVVTGHMLLRAPTGSGKTEAALLWAATQVEDLKAGTGGLPRVFYTLPYLASINAMTSRLQDELDGPGQDLIGVAHSHAASYYLRQAADDCSDDQRNGDVQAYAGRRALARKRATRLFREPVRVGTPYQLIRGAMAGPAHSGILIDAANSVFILDELHAYEPQRLGIILAMIRLWTRLGGRVGVLSATFPAALEELLVMALGETPAIVEPPAGSAWPVRHQLALRGTHLTDPKSVTEIAGQLRSGQSVLVVANNVKDAWNLYEQLSPEVITEHGADAALLLHSRFTARDRAAIEERILDRFQAGKPRQPGLLVATQTVEVSLNVDFDALHTSAAPLESLIQRFGRVNRLGLLATPAPVVVHEPAYGPRRSQPATDYADGVYDAEPVRLAWQILTRYEGAHLDERLYGQWLDEVYASAWGHDWAADVDRTYQAWDEGWLQFSQPFDDRGKLADDFDALFDGTEAVLEQHVDEYREKLTEHKESVGRLLAADLLLPVPAYGVQLGRWDRTLGVLVIDGDYDPASGLRQVRGAKRDSYVPGEVL